MGVQRIISNIAWSRRDQMFIAAALKLITAPAEPNVAAARTHRAPLERGLRADGGYKHLAALRPIHNYTTTDRKVSPLLHRRSVEIVVNLLTRDRGNAIFTNSTPKRHTLKLPSAHKFRLAFSFPGQTIFPNQLDCKSAFVCDRAFISVVIPDNESGDSSRTELGC